jgi:acylphosphatase|tara:strand:+ start:1719 stop:1997 length:279 start_codon:yes stop_codon:yes gene_type:complete
LSEKRLHIYVSGIVQGVFFRSNTVHKANSLQIKGWIKNLPDSSVEILAEGTEEMLDKFLDWCEKGPPNAEVDSVEVVMLPFKQEFNEFKIVY